MVKALGTSVSVLGLSSTSVVANEREERKISPSTEDFPNLQAVNVHLSEDSTATVEMTGKMPDDAISDRGYRVIVKNSQSERGEPTPGRATVNVVQVPEEELPPQDNEERVESNSTASGGGQYEKSDSSHEKSERSETQLNSQVGGVDGESDFKGGAWAVTQDPINIDCTLTELWLDWSYSSGNFSWNKWYWKCTSYDIWLPTGWSKWRWDGAETSSPLIITDGWVQTSVDGDYFNWTWGDDNKKTTAKGSVFLMGRADGSLAWTTSGQASGEDSGLLHFDGGYYSGYR
jgi:hypothetical protein